MKNDHTSQTEMPGSAAIQRETPQPKRILVVDDEPYILNICARVLISNGYHVDVAEDGAVAWRVLHAGSYDLMITDNEMPNVTGVELLKKLCTARMALPIIMATGLFPRDEFERSPWLQPTALLLKPYSVNDLIGTVKEVLCADDSVHTPDAPRGHRRRSLRVSTGLLV